MEGCLSLTAETLSLLCIYSNKLTHDLAVQYKQVDPPLEFAGSANRLVGTRQPQ